MHALDLRALEIFRTVAIEGSVSRAAVKLSRVQSNISTRIKQLEQHLDKPLFLLGIFEYLNLADLRVLASREAAYFLPRSPALTVYLC